MLRIRIQAQITANPTFYKRENFNHITFKDLTDNFSMVLLASEIILLSDQVLTSTTLQTNPKRSRFLEPIKLGLHIHHKQNNAGTPFASDE